MKYLTEYELSQVAQALTNQKITAEELVTMDLPALFGLQTITEAKIKPQRGNFIRVEITIDSKRACGLLDYTDYPIGWQPTTKGFKGPQWHIHNHMPNNDLIRSTRYY